MPERLLITGGAGFIGANFVHYWLQHYSDKPVVVLDALTYAGNKANLAGLANHPQFTFIKGDIGDQPLVESLLRQYAIDTIVHFAAESHVDRSITGPDAFIDTNILGTHSLLKAARTCWLNPDQPHRFHHVSTDEVYGALAPNDPPFSETTPYAPNSPYSASKAASDHLVRAYQETYGLQTTVSNCSNNYGPRHFPEKLIPLMITNILREKHLPIYGDGQQIRDWLYVEDHCRAIDLILHHDDVGETFNIGGNNEWANIDIVHTICRFLNTAFADDPDLKKRFPEARSVIDGHSERLIKHVTDRPGHDRRYAINPDKAREVLNYEARESFETGIRKTIHWYLDNETWWQAVLDGSYRQLK